MHLRSVCICVLKRGVLRRVFSEEVTLWKAPRRLRFRDLRSKTLAFKKALRSFLRFKDFPRGQGLRSGPLRSKNDAFCVCVLKPTKTKSGKEGFGHEKPQFPLSPPNPPKCVLHQKIRTFSVVLCFAMGTCRLTAPLSGVVRNGGFLVSNGISPLVA